MLQHGTTGMGAIPAIVTDRRRYPRVHLFRPMTLVDCMGNCINTNLRNITPDGVLAMCDHASATQLIPSCKLGINDPPVYVDASFNLPLDHEFLEMDLRCRVKWMLVVPDEGVALGMLFVEFRGESRGHLERFIVESMRPD